MKRSLDAHPATSPRKQVRFEKEDNRKGNKDVFDVCILLDHIAFNCRLLRDVLEGVVRRHAIPCQAYEKHRAKLAADWRGESAMEESARDMCVTDAECVWKTYEDRPKWAMGLSYVSFYRSDGDDDEHEDMGEYESSRDVSVAARVFLARLRSERAMSSWRCDSELLSLFDDAIASLVPLTVLDADARNHACHVIEIVRQRCPVLAPCLDPVIASHSTQDYDREEFKEMAESTALDLCSIEARALWKTKELRPAWAKDVDSVDIGDPAQPLALVDAARTLLLGIEAILQDYNASLCLGSDDRLGELELVFYEKLFDALRTVIEEEKKDC